MKLEDYIAQLEGATANFRFAHLVRICQEVFGNERISGSHHIFRTPWPGDPRINLQKTKGGSNAKPYQIKQVLAALRKKQEMEESAKKGDAQSVHE